MSNIDSITSNMILEAVKNVNSKSDMANVADLFKQIKTAPEEGPTEEQIEMVNFLMGKKVIVNGDAYIGKVVKLNESSRGFYPGGRYPAYVEIIELLDSDRESALGKTFKYCLSQLIPYKDNIELNAFIKDNKEDLKIILNEDTYKALINLNDVIKDKDITITIDPNIYALDREHNDLNWIVSRDTLKQFNLSEVNFFTILCITTLEMKDPGGKKYHISRKV